MGFCQRLRLPVCFRVKLQTDNKGTHHSEKGDVFVPERRFHFRRLDFFENDSEELLAELENAGQDSRKGEVVAKVFVGHPEGEHKETTMLILAHI